MTNHTLPTNVNDQSSAQDQRTAARQIGWLRSWGGRLRYLAIVVLLLGVLKTGHTTHWTFGLASAIPTSVPSPSQPSSSSSSVKVAEVSPAETSKEVSNLELSKNSIEKVGIRFGRVEKRPIRQTIPAHGIVSYNKNSLARLTSRVPGTVWRVEKQVGQAVRKGDVLAIVEARDVGQAKANLLQAVVKHGQTLRLRDRLKSVSEAVSDRARSDAEAEFRQAKIELMNSVQELVNLGLPIALREVLDLDDETLAKKLHFLGLPPEVVAGLDLHTTTTNLLPICAPFDGIVIGREMTVGEVVAPSESHFEIADTRRMWIVLEVRKEDANLVRIGQRIQFTPDGMAGEISANVDWISTEVDSETRTLQVRAEVDNPVLPITTSTTGTPVSEQRLLRAQAFGMGEILVREEDWALTVPNDAVHWERGHHVVYAYDGERFSQIKIVSGVRERHWTEIRSGLKDDMVVATEGSHVIKAELQIVASQP